MRSPHDAKGISTTILLRKRPQRPPQSHTSLRHNFENELISADPTTIRSPTATVSMGRERPPAAHSQDRTFDRTHQTFPRVRPLANNTMRPNFPAPRPPASTPTTRLSSAYNRRPVIESGTGDCVTTTGPTAHHRTDTAAGGASTERYAYSAYGITPTSPAAPDTGTTTSARHTVT